MEYEGDYSYNKKWNGKGYDENGNIIYELINGNGKVKEYDNYGNLKFEGIYLYNNKLKGKEYFKERVEYEGEYLYNIKWNEKGYDENGNIIYE